jgi:hypothetical protein
MWLLGGGWFRVDARLGITALGRAGTESRWAYSSCYWAATGAAAQAAPVGNPPLIITLRFDSSSPISLSSLAYNFFELAPKVTHID